MIKNIIILTVFAIAIFLLSRYYQQSSMIFKDDAVTLQVKGKNVSLNHTVNESNHEHFTNVDVLQKELKRDGSTLYYEEATINGLYQFNNIKEVIGILFNANKIEEKFFVRELVALQVTTESGEVINLFVTDNDTKSFQLLYGLDNDQFKSTMVTLLAVQKLDKKLENASSLSKKMTQWSVLNNDFLGMISSIDY